MRLQAKVLVAGQGQGQVLHLLEDISFWGAVDPLTGTIIDERHPQAGALLGRKIIVMHRSVGSSSGSAVLLETLHRGCGPAGIILGEGDQILTLGALIAREMEYASIPVLQFDSNNFGLLSGEISIDIHGTIRVHDNAG